MVRKRRGVPVLNKAQAVASIQLDERVRVIGAAETERLAEEERQLHDHITRLLRVAREKAAE